MAAQEIPDSFFPPERFVVEALSELRPETIQARWRHLNVMLRLAMLTGLQMQVESTLNLICDMVAEIVDFDRAVVWYSEEGEKIVRPRVMRGPAETGDGLAGVPGGNILHAWAEQSARPLLVERGLHPQADEALDSARSALVVPLFASSQVVGSMQLFSGHTGHFSAEDAQLLWVFSLVAENLLSRGSANDGLLRFAFTDYLTGLRTRRFFEQQLELELKRSQRHQQSFALLMIDIDHFKRLNDTFGHHVGDQALRDVSFLLMQDMREADTSARYGGEEFTIILPETSEEGARQVAERLRRAVEQASFSAGSGAPPQKLTVSVGIAVFDRDARYRNELIESADTALYAAKHAGRNRVICYSELAGRRGL
ncbi:MAG: GGDEF domain-containing protein [Acidobacteriia bacterium]|nr:GGDEF domain-containing protein [Terriglobia bacterium]